MACTLAAATAANVSAPLLSENVPHTDSKGGSPYQQAARRLGRSVNASEIGQRCEKLKRGE